MNLAPYGVLLSPRLARKVEDARWALELLRLSQPVRTGPTVDELVADKRRVASRERMKLRRAKAGKRGTQPA